MDASIHFYAKLEHERERAQLLGFLMATRYLIFASLAAAQNASSADWAVRILGHPTLTGAVTKYLWGIISNSAGTIGVITDNVPLSQAYPARRAGRTGECDHADAW